MNLLNFNRHQILLFCKVVQSQIWFVDLAILFPGATRSALKLVQFSIQPFYQNSKSISFKTKKGGFGKVQSLSLTAFLSQTLFRLEKKGFHNNFRENLICYRFVLINRKSGNAETKRFEMVPKLFRFSEKRLTSSKRPIFSAPNLIQLSIQSFCWEVDFEKKIVEN